jgi:hypothetical protein
MGLRGKGKWAREREKEKGPAHCVSRTSRPPDSGTRLSACLNTRSGTREGTRCGGPSKLVNMFIFIIDHTTTSCHTRFICSSHSSTGWIRLQQLSMVKHIIYTALAMHRSSNLVLLGAVDQEL